MEVEISVRVTAGRVSVPRGTTDVSVKKIVLAGMIDVSTIVENRTDV